jgi:hypothetical protein
MVNKEYIVNYTHHGIAWFSQVFAETEDAAREIFLQFTNQLTGIEITTIKERYS